ncbi:DUF3000 domain-containing protein [Streptomyces sp. MST-110588]|uniref:DUF3000 domain-containing protein n=1 Tax=Streptomyces sp. MST-110588 TaxID=2833628 RepID=UPI001F5D1F65|nr:DUF3000 domain-containing protein [Streptomyces sp. MST-110588]UNO39456.1 DUF3000 domain-containing protein [Streptomyces sp. MST-110588]
MAAAHGHLADGADGADTTPAPFRQAVQALRAARTRLEVEVEPMPAPKRLAPYACAFQASVLERGGTGAQGEGEELADGRFVLLYDPAGHDAWRGTFRVVTLARAELEPEMGADPLLPEVSWSWLTGALEARGVLYGEPSGTVTRAGSSYFGGLAEQEPSTQIEIRASWTPAGEPEGGSQAPPDLGAHLVAWCDLLCQVAGLPPLPQDTSSLGGVVPLPQRRGPQPT